ncbi:MAG TPA: hypothetical protein VGA78_16430 [Gemmatimonadales bacterium]|jgi:hypothetical protein
MEQSKHPVSNIGPGGQRKRATWGAGSLAVAVGLAVVLIATDQPRLFRLILAVPLWGAGLGLLQAKGKT